MVTTYTDLMNAAHRFRDRKDGGIRLSRILEFYTNKEPLVIGIPRGGAEVAYQVSKMIHGDLTMIASGKLPFPGNKELSFGAVAEDGSIYLTALANRLSGETIDRIIEEQLAEVTAKGAQYRGGQPIPDMRNRTVIIVDDGIATGVTIVPVIKLCRAANAQWTVVASPVSGNNYVSDITVLADDVKILEQPDDFFAVGQMYENFYNLTDEDVVFLLEEFRREALISRKIA